MNRRFAAALLAPLLAVAGCTAGGPDETATSRGAAQTSPFADCAALTAAPSAGSASPSAGPASAGPTTSPGSGRSLPDLRLACFTGGAEVALREVRGPAVINLWASWCGPCRTELPAFQRLSERMAGQVHVIGVNTRDDRPRAVSVGEDFGVTFPTLVDTNQRLLRELPPAVVPTTIFVDAGGRVRHQDVSGVLDDVRLAELVRRHLGVEVPA